MSFILNAILFFNEQNVYFKSANVYGRSNFVFVIHFFGSFVCNNRMCSLFKPPLSQHVGEIPLSNFQFDFDFERKVLAELEKETQNWTKLGVKNLPQRTAESPSSSGPVGDPIVRKYIALGLNREAVPLAVVNYGDNPTKVREFVDAFTLLREMGFSSNSVAEALLMYDKRHGKGTGTFSQHFIVRNICETLFLYLLLLECNALFRAKFSFRFAFLSTVVKKKCF